MQLPRLRAVCDSAEGCVHLRTCPLPLGQEVLTKRDEIMTVSLMGCWQQYASSSAVLSKLLFKHSGTISVLAMVWCHWITVCSVQVFALNLLCLFSSCCLSGLCSCAVRMGLHRATTRLLVHQFLIKFELKILFPLG